MLPAGLFGLVLVLVTAALHSWQISQIAKSESALDRVINLRVSIDHLARNLHEVEANFHGYLRTQSPTRLDGYRSAVAHVNQELKALSITLEADGGYSKQWLGLIGAFERTLALQRDALEPDKGGGDEKRLVGEITPAYQDARTALAILAGGIGESMKQASQSHANEVRAGHAVFLASLFLNLSFILFLLVWYAWSAGRAKVLHDSMTLQNTRLTSSLGDTARLHDGLRKASQLGRSLQQSHDLNSALKLLREQLPQHMEATEGALYLPEDRSNSSMRLAFSWGQHAFAESLQSHECSAPAWAEPAPPCTDVVLPCAHIATIIGAGNANWVCLPLLAKGGFQGALTLRLEDGVQGLNDLDAIVVEQTALTLGSLAIREALREQSVRDPLTGLYNRRYLEEAMKQELSRLLRVSSEGEITYLVAMMLDVDHFKCVNDRCGHEVGDRVLTAVAQALQQQIRAGDVLARYGGEEFTILLVEVDLEIGRSRAELIRQSIERIRAIEGQAAQITISVGVAACGNEDMTTGELLSRADEALYQAKRTGRNWVVCAWDDLVDIAARIPGERQ